MKKIFIIITAIVLIALSVVACVFAFIPKTVYATNICVLTNKIVLQVGEQYNLSNTDYLIMPANYSQRPVFSSSNENIATVDVFSGKIIAHNIGSCDIVITAKLSDTQTINNKIVLEVIQKRYLPTNVNISTTSLELYINQTVSLNTNFVGTTNVLPSVSTLNNCVIYDFVNDSIIATKEGSDTLTICYVLSDGTTKTFNIDIVVKNKQIYTSNVTINKETLDYVILEYFTKSSKSECIIKNSSNLIEIIKHEYRHISVKPLNVGECTLIVDSPTSTNIFYILIV